MQKAGNILKKKRETEYAFQVKPNYSRKYIQIYALLI
jgi:hypothetical protein